MLQDHDDVVFWRPVLGYNAAAVQRRLGAPMPRRWKAGKPHKHRYCGYFAAKPRAIAGSFGGEAASNHLPVLVIAFELLVALVIACVRGACFLVNTSNRALRTGLIAVACCKEGP